MRFGPLEAGRNRPVDHLFVLGLAEGEFPRQPAPDVFYAAAERESHPLPLLRLHPADDACLWWQVVGNCRRSLALLRPRLDNNGAPWLHSPYWGAVLERVAGLEQRVIQLPIAEAPAPERSASPNELLVALAMSRARVVPSPLHSAWQNAQDAHQVMERRRSWSPLGDHEGVLSSPDLLADLQRRYGTDHVWSASRLGRYGACPYLFFAEAVLGLEALPDPVAGMDAMQLGSLLHAILERLYRQLTQVGLAPTPANQESVLACLESTCQELFPTAPQRYGFRPGELWSYEQKEMQRLLRALVIWGCQENGDAPRFHPDQQELRFGMKGDALPALRVGETFYLHGVMDRLDRDAAGNLRVIDYKSGSTTYSGRQIEEGLALQTALYTLVARQVAAAAAVAESYYLHISTRKRSGQLRFPDDEGKVQAAVERAAHFVRQVRAGRFPRRPRRGFMPRNLRHGWPLPLHPPEHRQGEEGRSAMKLTEEQRLAIETEDRALLVEAGAGTGKTAVLVQRFLYLLDRHPDWPLESIVAVTFTEKAAREMRARIRQEVEQKASQAPFDAIWQERRRNLDRLMVNTIHGFCARLLRENAIAAQVDPRFQVLEETEADLLKEESLRQTFAELGAVETDDAALDLLANLRCARPRGRDDGPAREARHRRPTLRSASRPRDPSGPLAGGRGTDANSRMARLAAP